MPFRTRASAEAGKARSVARPNMYAVVMHNDDITTVDFVVEILMRVFNKSSMQARSLVSQIHRQGSGIAGIYTYDLALTKRQQAEHFAEENAFPLRFSVEIS